jgi:hypothetical protein
MPNRSNNPQGRTDADEEIQYQRERSAEDSGTANGLLIGSLLALVTGLGVAAYYWSRPSVPTPTTIINNPPSPAASVSPAPQKQTTIIDRTVEKTAPPQVKVVEVEKPVVVPGATKVIEVPKPFAVPGATKTIEVPKPFAVPAAPSTAEKSDAPKASPAPSAQPSPAASESPAPVSSPSPSTEPVNN